MEIKTKEYLIEGENYFPNIKSKKTDTLPPGVYEPAVTASGVPYLKTISITTDTIVAIPNSFTEEILKDVAAFWSEEISDKFKQYGLVHKRGILLAGKPGTGKTITLAQIASNVVEKHNGVVLFNPDPGTLVDFVRLIKAIEPNKKILVLWEEFDSILNSNESTLLPLLDGETQVSNIMYVATTNYLSRIPARIKNRPSRFAKVVIVEEPSAEARRHYLNAKLHESDKDLLEPLVEASEGFVVDQLKDLIISVCCFKYQISTAVRKIKEMNDGGIGVDDFNEEQASNVFKSNKKRSSGPLRPIY